MTREQWATVLVTLLILAAAHALWFAVEALRERLANKRYRALVETGRAEVQAEYDRIAAQQAACSHTYHQRGFLMKCSTCGRFR